MAENDAKYQFRPSRHPGRGKKPARRQLKGRQTEPAALTEVRALLGDAPRSRDLLIEHLHRIQDHYGHLSARHLAALAKEMNLPMTEVYETATFYAHFDVVKEGEDPPPALSVRVCDSLTCALNGAETLISRLRSHTDGGVRIVRAPCMGRCDTAPVAEVGHYHVDEASDQTVLDCIEAGRHEPEIPAYQTYDEYVEQGGYSLLSAFLSGEKTRESLKNEIAEAGLKGLGGAGFPSAKKWDFVLANPKPRLLAINADEGEPGTFKDRYFMERRPHQFLEGTLLTGWAVEADKIYIYLRDEYPAVREILLREIARLEKEGLIEPGHLVLRRGAGAYICGEESAMLESIEGKRGLPRHKPPFPAQVGLFGLPTLIHNVETVYWIPEILEKGAGWFNGQGRNGRSGLRSFSVSGRVNDPGVKIAPAGITLNELIDEYCGGMQDGHELKGYLPGGASGGILPASKADVPLDFGTLEEHGCFIGSAAIIVFSDKDDIRDVARNVLEFFEDESCGQCTPCRVGTEKAVKLMRQKNWDKALLDDLCEAMADASICGLGQAAGNPIGSAFQYFEKDVTNKNK